MPFGLVLALASRLVFPAFGCSDVQMRDASAVLECADFGVAAQIADEDDFIDAACHGVPFKEGSWMIEVRSIQCRVVVSSCHCVVCLPYRIEQNKYIVSFCGFIQDGVNRFCFVFVIFSLGDFLWLAMAFF